MVECWVFRGIVVVVWGGIKTLKSKMLLLMVWDMFGFRDVRVSSEDFRLDCIPGSLWNKQQQAIRKARLSTVKLQKSSGLSFSVVFWVLPFGYCHSGPGTEV